jgi:hypothetical protein
MKRLFLLPTAALAVFAGCNRSGVIDITVFGAEPVRERVLPCLR